MADKAWKQAERRLARFFGAERQALSGSRCGSGQNSDSTHAILYLESKQRAREALFDLRKDCQEKAKKSGHKAVVIGLHSKSHQGMMLCIHSDDLLRVALEHLRAIESKTPFVGSTRAAITALDFIIRCS